MACLLHFVSTVQWEVLIIEVFGLMILKKLVDQLFVIVITEYETCYGFLGSSSRLQTPTLET